MQPTPEQVTPAAGDGTVVVIARDVLAVLGATSLLFGILWTVARSWTRDRLYSLLKSEPQQYKAFVLDIVTHEGYRNEIGNTVLDTLTADHHRDRFRAIIGELYENELATLREMRHNVQELGLRTGELVVTVSTMQEMTQNFAAAQMESSKTTAVLAESLRSLADSIGNIRDDMGKISDKVDRTHEIILSGFPGTGRRRPPRGQL